MVYKVEGKIKMQADSDKAILLLKDDANTFVFNGQGINGPGREGYTDITIEGEMKVDIGPTFYDTLTKFSLVVLNGQAMDIIFTGSNKQMYEMTGDLNSEDLLVINGTGKWSKV